MIFFSFSKNFLNVDFFSRLFEFKINWISCGSFSISSSIIVLTLSVTLFMIISFSLSKNDFVSTLLKNSFFLSNISFSSYLWIFSGYLFSNKSLIIYQTVTPLNETLKDVLENNPEKFLNNELIIRKNKNLPPFSRLISLIVSANSSQDSFRAAQEIKKKLSVLNHLEVLGPVDSPIFKINKKYRTRLLLRSKNTNLIQKSVGKILENLNISKKIKLTVDVDPINFA